ncbi:hypothetical protein POM88_034636 [Heracleum sosnowskyi]|uniref:KIB1-4 beta-propeller domain-containing protein n=1 Tax=Heracleum sosnowskyi TaxID=360622 RepID=A0AAD8HJY7_9APIA|nr:hypothetical protein POM88_034636 [Heracleum sosnowskyi]
MRTFSTDPHSPDCVFFLSDTRCVASSKIAIITYRNGDKEWTAKQFDIADEFVPCNDCIPIYFQGIFYLVSPFGQIASYDILTGEFRFVNLVMDNQFELDYNSYQRYEVFELNGYLTRINYGSLQGMYNDNFPRNPCIKRFDWSSNAWIPVSSLGDQSVFVGKQFFDVGRVKARHDEVLPNKMLLEEFRNNQNRRLLE